MLLAPLRLGTTYEHIYRLVEVQMVAGAAPFIELIIVAEKIE